MLGSRQVALALYATLPILQIILGLHGGKKLSTKQKQDTAVYEMALKFKSKDIMHIIRLPGTCTCTWGNSEFQVQVLQVQV